MRNSQHKLMEAVAGIIPGELQGQLSHVIDEWAGEALAEMDAMYESRLEEMDQAHQAEMAELKQKVEENYRDAYEMIVTLRRENEAIREEYEQQLSEGYEEAYQMLLAERKKNDNLEVDLYEEYDDRVGRIREFYIDKVDEFMSEKGEQMYEIVRRDLLNDSAFSESRVVLEKVLEAVNPLVGGIASHAHGKPDQSTRQLAEAQAQVRILEARNMRLHTENSKLNEAARHAHALLQENVQSERRARREVARTAQSRGTRVVEDQQIITEATNHAEPNATGHRGRSSGNQLLETWRHLSGLDGEGK